MLSPDLPHEATEVEEAHGRFCDVGGYEEHEPLVILAGNRSLLHMRNRCWEHCHFQHVLYHFPPCNPHTAPGKPQAPDPKPLESPKAPNPEAPHPKL